MEVLCFHVYMKAQKHAHFHVFSPFNASHYIIVVKGLLLYFSPEEWSGWTDDVAGAVHDGVEVLHQVMQYVGLGAVCVCERERRGWGEALSCEHRHEGCLLERERGRERGREREREGEREGEREREREGEREGEREREREREGEREGERERGRERGREREGERERGGWKEGKREREMQWVKKWLTQQIHRFFQPC